MKFFYAASQCVPAAASRLAGVFVVAAFAAMIAPSRADLILSTSSSASSSAIHNGFPVGNHHNASGGGNLTNGSSAHYFSFASTSNSVNLTETTQASYPFATTLTGNLSQSGFSRSTFFADISTNDNATLNGALTLTNQPYAFTISAAGAASDSGNDFFTTDIVGGVDGSQGFSNSAFGVLDPGTYNFSAGVNGSSADSRESSSLSFQITLTPIPEPATWSLMGLGALGLAGGGWMWRRLKVAEA